jgi:hypothetical protein
MLHLDTKSIIRSRGIIWLNVAYCDWIEKKVLQKKEINDDNDDDLSNSKILRITGFIVHLMNLPVCWGSKAQRGVILSSIKGRNYNYTCSRACPQNSAFKSVLSFLLHPLTILNANLP